jgi:hypothetical protein
MSTTVTVDFNFTSATGIVSCSAALYYLRTGCPFGRPCGPPDDLITTVSGFPPFNTISLDFSPPSVDLSRFAYIQIGLGTQAPGSNRVVYTTYDLDTTISQKIPMPLLELPSGQELTVLFQPSGDNSYWNWNWLVQPK